MLQIACNRSGESEATRVRHLRRLARRFVSQMLVKSRPLHLQNSIAMESELMLNLLISTHWQASDDGALLHLGEQPTTPFVQAMLGATAVECIPISATVSNDGACNNEFVIHYEGTMDVALFLLLLWTKRLRE